MRTTLDIDEDVLHAAKELARQQRSTTGKVVSELARRALTESAAEADAVQDAPPTYGFRPFAGGRSIVTDADVERVRNEEGI